MKPKLIDNWRAHLWQAWSSRIAYLATVPGLAWPLIPQDLRDALPPGVVTAFAILAGGSIVIAKMIDQPRIAGGDESGCEGER